VRAESIKKTAKRLAAEGRYQESDGSWNFNRALTYEEALACLALPRPHIATRPVTR